MILHHLNLKILRFPMVPSENFSSGTLSKTNYLSLANSTISFMETNKSAPVNITCSLGQIGFQSMVYIFSQILDVYDKTNSLPVSVSVKGNTLSGNVLKNQPQLLNSSSYTIHVVEIGWLLEMEI